LTSADVQELRERGAVPAAAPCPSQPPAATSAFPFFDRVLAGMIAAGHGIQALCLFLGLTRLALDEHIVRLCLRTPDDRPLRKPGPKSWSVRDTVRLIFWRLAGVHPEIIGQRLEVQRSANAVRAKARRLGLPAPARKDLFKCDPASLGEPEPGFLFGFGRSRRHEAAVPSASEQRPNRNTDALNPPGTAPDAPEREAATAAKPVIESGKRRGGAEPTDQRQLPLVAIIDGARRGNNAESREIVSSDAVPPIPTTEDDVDLSGDLTWFRRLRWTNPLTNRAAVWTCCMLIAGSLDYKAAAERLGISEAAFRSVRTRMDVPVDHDRSKAGKVFDEEAARVTVERSGYVLKRCIQGKNWFWAKKTDHGTRLSPPHRTGEKIIGRRSNLFTIITREMLDAERRFRPAPFARSPARVCA